MQGWIEGWQCVSCQGMIVCRYVVRWCSGYHVRLTRGRSPVRSRAEPSVLPWLTVVLESNYLKPQLPILILAVTGKSEETSIDAAAAIVVAFQRLPVDAAFRVTCLSGVVVNRA